MDRSELEKASREDLIELVMKQHETFLKVQETNQQLVVRVHELEKRLNRPEKTSRNSSSRPSAERKGKRENRIPGKKSGPKVGHPGKSRERSEPDVTIECKVETCQDCGADLRESSYRELGRSQVVELPPVKPVVVEAIRYGCECPACGKQQEATYPEGLEAERVFGNRLETTVTYLHQLHHVSYNRLETVLDVLFDLTISRGALINIAQRVSSKLAESVKAIREKVQASDIVQSDETGARVNGTNQWQWVFIGDDATYHVIADSRSAQVIKDVMGTAMPIVWVSDLFSAQCTAESQLRQICLAHQSRDLQFAMDAERSVWAYQFRQLLFRAQRLAKRRAELSLPHFYSAICQIEDTCDALLSQSLSGTEESRLQRRYLKHRGSIFTFLYNPTVPPDNNASERALRNSVIHRKVSGGFRSDDGAAAHAAVASVVDTAKQNNEQPFSVLSALIGAPTPIPV